MTADRRNIALILAGGTGSRAGFNVPKQFVELSGRTMIERTVDAFEAAPAIDGIVVVSSVQTAQAMRSLVLANRWTKLIGLCNGGVNRFASGNAGLALCPQQGCNVLIHDAARPLVSQRLIADVCRALEVHRAVCAAVPATDSLMLSADGGKTVERYLDRSAVWNVQTPQAFRTEVIREAYTEALRHSDFVATDDCSVVRKYLPGVEIAIVRGDETNIKLTYPSDRERIERLLAEHNGSAL